MKKTLIIACGALAHELVAVLNANQWQHFEIKCLPAKWHNTPDKITPGVASLIEENRGQYASTLVAYGDCGTGGQLDSLLAREKLAGEKIERLPGDHCYSFFAGARVFDEIAEQELGTFYLTDYLAANFERLILQDLGIKAHPELKDMYFNHYKRLIYLAQQPTPKLVAQAQAAADTLGLTYLYRETGLAPLEQSFKHIKIVNSTAANS